MFRSLYPLGLKPENISLTGKCYSSNREVYLEMVAEGIDLDPNSFAYSSHASFDEQFSEQVKAFILSRLERIKKGNYSKIIVLDDGGKCIQIIQNSLDRFPPLVAVEQTSAGYQALKEIALEFPVINVARSRAKLTLESPMIAQAAVERLIQSLQNSHRSPSQALIIGAGPIGKSVGVLLAKRGLTCTFHDKQQHETPHLVQQLKTHDLILGCTGSTSIPQALHLCLNPLATLASVSSSDREFDAVFFRRLLPANSLCHKDLLIRDLLLVKSGFPINFDGERENIAPESIQLTIALMAAALLQGVEQDLIRTSGLIALSPQWGDFVEESYLNLPAQPGASPFKCSADFCKTVATA
jgi:hypothetical protein